MDESDRRLAEALQGALAEGRYEVGVEDAADDAFNRALNAYRTARAAQDTQAMVAAQAEMQKVVRQEMAEAERPCQDRTKESGAPRL